MIITYNGTPYQILNSYTMKAYIYWDFDNPYELIASNIILEDKVNRYYLMWNDKGNPTMVPQQDLEISFSEGVSRDLITEKIIAFGEKNSINDKRFTTLEVDVNGIKTTVGKIEKDVDGTKQTISQIEQKNDEISASVENVTKEYNLNKELQTLRDDVNIALLDLQSTLGLFNSEMNTYMEDNKLSDEEGASITTYKEIINEQKEVLNTQIDKVISFLNENKQSDNVTKLSSQKGLLNDSFTNLFSNINTVISDRNFTNTEMTTVVTYFARANTKINEINTMIDDFIFLGSSGSLIKQISDLTIRQDEIKLSVKEETKTLNEELSSMEERVQSTESKLTKESLTTTIGDFYLKEEDIEGSLDLTAYAKTSEVKQTVDALTATFKESGGYNRLYNSAFLTGDLTYWTNWGSCTRTVENSTASGFSKQLKITTTNTNQGVSQEVTGLKTGKKYTLSALVYAKSGIGAIQVYNNGTYHEKTTTTTSGFEKLSVTFVAITTQVTVRLGRHGGGSNGTYCYTGILLAEGELEMPWSPHPSEIYDGITTIDKNGIRVSQSNYNGYTQMKADGFYVNNGSENVISVTSSGATFKGKVTVQSGSTVPTSVLSGTISNSQLNSSITNDISTAKSNANTALSTANTANATVNNNKINWDNAYKRVSEWAYGAVTGSTTIDGGLIQTNTIIADKIAANAIIANKIAANAITSNKIAAGAITADKIAAKAITADKIAAGAITANMITSGTMSADRISGGTIKGVTLQTYADDTSAGVRIYSESMYLNGTKFLYESSDNFRISADQTLTLSSPRDIYLMPGLTTNTSQTGSNTVVIPNAMLRAQKLTVINNATIQGTCAISGQVSCSGLTATNSVIATNGFSSTNGGVYVSGTITTTGGNINATAGQVKSSTLYVTGKSTLSGVVSCGGNLTATAGTITAATIRSNGALNCATFGCSGDASFSNNVWIKYLYVNGTWVSSDERLKTDIKYVNTDIQSIGNDGLMSPNVNITTGDMHEFIETLPMVSYRMIEELNDNKDNTHYGFLAQEIMYSKVGSELVEVPKDEYGNETGGYLKYSQNKFVSFICGALQEEIKLRKELQERVVELENKLKEE